MVRFNSFIFLFFLIFFSLSSWSLFFFSLNYLCLEKTNIHQSFKRAVVILKRKMQKHELLLFYFILFSYILRWEIEMPACLTYLCYSDIIFFSLSSPLQYKQRRFQSQKRRKWKKIGLVSSSFSLVFFVYFLSELFF